MARQHRHLHLFLQLLAMLFSLASTTLAGEHPRFAVARVATPVLNSPDIRAVFGGRSGSFLKTDRCQQIRELEFIALPGTLFRIEAALSNNGNTIFRVTTADYPYPSSNGYYIDSRLVDTSDIEPLARVRRLPERNTIIARLLSAVGTRYVWGGNIRVGVAEMLSLYPPSTGRIDRERWQLAGLDCSGLLYEATDGWTPRNTSTLVNYGHAVPVKGLNAAAMARQLVPLDLLVWPGHVLIVLDQERVVESRLDCKTGQGVVLRPLKQALVELLRQRQPLDDYRKLHPGSKGFVVRRWYEDVLRER